jgi:2-oxoglutarate ferredoxin oxidoreductase subunit delta
MSILNPIASSAVRRTIGQPSSELAAELDAQVALAIAQGLHFEGLPLALALLDKKGLQRLKKLVFNPHSLTTLRARAEKVEFITEGPLPPELLLEPAAKKEPVYTQVVDYALCKSCRLCIEICPKRVYTDDGFGKPYTERRDEECTGDIQCAQCVSICPERAISLQMTSPMHASTVFVQVHNPYAAAEARRTPDSDFAVTNPLAAGEPLQVDAALPADDLMVANRLLDEAGFHPVLELAGTPRHFVDAPDPAAELAAWAKENGRSPQRVIKAVTALYAALPGLAGLRQGKYALGTLIHRFIDEVGHAGVNLKSRAGAQLARTIVDECREPQAYLGAKSRAIGGLLPPGTSTAWKTPYGNEVPAYRHLEKCLGPECGLCVTHCPEGNGGETSAIKMIPTVPLGTIPALVRGLRAYLLKADGSHAKTEDLEDLSGRQAFTFEVNPDYCKACGTCIACCPHDVIEPEPRSFNMGEAL